MRVTPTSSIRTIFLDKPLQLIKSLWHLFDKYIFRPITSLFSEAKPLSKDRVKENKTVKTSGENKIESDLMRLKRMLYAKAGCENICKHINDLYSDNSYQAVAECLDLILQPEHTFPEVVEGLDDKIFQDEKVAHYLILKDVKNLEAFNSFISDLKFIQNVLSALNDKESKLELLNICIEQNSSDTKQQFMALALELKPELLLAFRESNSEEDIVAAVDLLFSSDALKQNNNCTSYIKFFTKQNINCEKYLTPEMKMDLNLIFPIFLMSKNIDLLSEVDHKKTFEKLVKTESCDIDDYLGLKWTISDSEKKDCLINNGKYTNWVMKEFGETLINNKESALAIIKADYKLYNQISVELRSSNEFKLEAIKADHRVVDYFDFNDDCEFIVEGLKSGLEKLLVLSILIPKLSDEKRIQLINNTYTLDELLSDGQTNQIGENSLDFKLWVQIARFFSNQSNLPEIMIKKGFLKDFINISILSKIDEFKPLFNNKEFILMLLNQFKTSDGEFDLVKCVVIRNLLKEDLKNDPNIKEILGSKIE